MRRVRAESLLRVVARVRGERPLRPPPPVRRRRCLFDVRPAHSRPRGTVDRMPNQRPRVQVTVDPELAAALDGYPRRGTTRAARLRELALRGADVKRAEARAHLLRIAEGGTTYDFAAAREIHEARERRG